MHATVGEGPNRFAVQVSAKAHCAGAVETTTRPSVPYAPVKRSAGERGEGFSPRSTSTPTIWHMAGHVTRKSFVPNPKAPSPVAL
jgi:hypothetical protein